ncbi:hypothetical protein ACNQVK_04615 [Mycobacterium sp. 134]|uniref:hypothetical protein n=1 Tax=Mycobacteriaceae TaxID=1762 RepID=UPI003AAB4AEF
MSSFVAEDTWGLDMRESAGVVLAARIDQLRESLIVAADPAGHCGPTAVRLSPDADVPCWLRTALADAELTQAEGPWPGWARCWSGVDWPGLVAEHPDDIGVDEYSLTSNTGVDWSTLAAFWQWLLGRSIEASLDVELGVDVDDAPGRVELFLYALEAHVGSAQVSQVTSRSPWPDPDFSACSCGGTTLRWHLA